MGIEDLIFVHVHLLLLCVQVEVCLLLHGFQLLINERYDSIAFHPMFLCTYVASIILYSFDGCYGGG